MKTEFFKLSEWFKRVDIDIRRGGKYLTRWHIIPRNKRFNIYLHKFHESDDTSFGLHDHPWNFFSIVLWGEYVEERQHNQGKWMKLRRMGSMAFRWAESVHAVYLMKKKPVWSLVFTGRKRRTWGFHSVYGFIPHYQIGRGFFEEEECEMRKGE